MLLFWWRSQSCYAQTQILLLSPPSCKKGSPTASSASKVVTSTFSWTSQLSAAFFPRNLWAGSLIISDTFCPRERHNCLRRPLETKGSQGMAPTPVDQDNAAVASGSFSSAVGMLAPHTNPLQTCGEKTGCRTHKLFLCRKKMKTK